MVLMPDRKRSRRSDSLTSRTTRGEDVPLVEDSDDRYSVRERRNVQHVEQSRLRRTDASACDDDFYVGHDFNGTTSNLSRDRQSLEGRLRGTSRTDDIPGCIGICTSGSSHFVGSDDLPSRMVTARRIQACDPTVEIPAG